MIGRTIIVMSTTPDLLLIPHLIMGIDRGEGGLEQIQHIVFLNGRTQIFVLLPIVETPHPTWRGAQYV